MNRPKTQCSCVSESRDEDAREAREEVEAAAETGSDLRMCHGGASGEVLQLAVSVLKERVVWRCKGALRVEVTTAVTTDPLTDRHSYEDETEKRRTDFLFVLETLAKQVEGERSSSVRLDSTVKWYDVVSHEGHHPVSVVEGRRDG